MSDKKVVTSEANPATEPVAEPTKTSEQIQGEFVAWLAKVDETDLEKLKADSVENRQGRQVVVTAYVEGKEEQYGNITLPRQDYIQALFDQDWHRGNITKTFTGDVPYQIVFAATKGRSNKHHQEGKGGSTSSAGRAAKTYTVTVGEEERVMDRKQLFKYLVEEQQLDRNGIKDFMRSHYGEEIAYATIYQYTKELVITKQAAEPKADKKTTKKDVAASPDAKADKKATKKAPKKEAEPAPADPADDNESKDLQL